VIVIDFDLIMGSAWVLEWSPTQKCIHIDQLGRVLATNLKTSLRGDAPGYIPLGIFASSEEAHDAASSLEPALLEAAR
jgi:hypothetical protein